MSPLRSSAGPAVCTNGTSSSVGDDLRERGLAEPGRARQQQVVERLAARACTPRSPPRAARAAPPGRRTPPAAAGAASGRARPRRPGRASGCGRRSRSSRSRARPRAGAARSPISSSALSPSASAQQLLGLLGPVAELEQPCAGERARLAAPRRGGRRSACGRRAARLLAGHLLAQLDDDPLGGALADARHRLQARGVAGRERRRRARCGGAAESTASATFGPTAWTDSSIRNRSRSRSEWKPYSVERVVARRSGACAASPCSPTRRHVAQRLRRDRRAVADAAAQHHHVVGRRTATSPGAARSSRRPRQRERAAARG